MKKKYTTSNWFRVNGFTQQFIGRMTEGSYAYYLLYKKQLNYIQDSKVITKFKNGKQMLFNTEFVHSRLLMYGELHCEFCGKADLMVGEWWIGGSKENTATADHFYPRSKNKDLLSCNILNMVVACHSCNNIKSDLIYDMSTIKYPYIDTINRLIRLKQLFNI